MNIAIIYGGRSTEHDASLASFHNIKENLSPDITIVYSIFINRDGICYLNNKKKPIEKIIEFIKKKNIFLVNLLHGNEGEDGAWQGIAEVCDIDGSFETVSTASITMNKYFQSSVSKAISGLYVPKSLLITKNENLKNIINKIKKLNIAEIIIKPNSMGASHFVKRLRLSNRVDISAQINEILKFDRGVIIQEFIHGDEYTCGVVSISGQLKALPVIQVSAGSGFLSHTEKHTAGMMDVQFVDDKISKKIQKLSLSLCELYGIQGMCRFDFLVDKNNKVYFLEGNHLPGLSKGSAFPRMLEKGGYSLNDLLVFLINAFTNKKKIIKELQYTIED